MSNKLNVIKMSDDDLQDLFSESFERNIAINNDITSYECICKRGTLSTDIIMEVTISGMAGSPSKEDFKSLKIKNCKSLKIEVEGKGELEFVLAPKETISLNTNDYMVIYKAI